MALLRSVMVAAAGTAALDSSNPLSITIGAVGGVVGVVGLFLSWSSGRAAKRLEQLIAMEQDARSRGPLAADDLLAVRQHWTFLEQLDEEIRLHQQFALRAARRVGSATSTAAVVGWALYGAFLIAAGFYVASVDRPVSDVVAGESWVLALGGVTCWVRSIVLGARRFRIWEARRDTGITDLYSQRTLARLRQIVSIRRPR
ncbi:hypothetical protein [Curtobacterium sp. 458]|uniref:hypothetical protein n=1 Tax=Curtobacterium sp. 458 TaxID=3050069 RepID=UPI0025B50E1F|nr:hypothetical protein [Curtobacterium sp. 458]WJY00381.1 hypothetical protein QPJ90_01500 [Curtobacterium sp. 458]